MAPNILSLASSIRTLNPEPSLGYQFRYPLPMNCGIAYVRDDPRKKNIAGQHNLLR